MSTDRSRRGLTDDDASSLLSLDPHATLGVSPGATARELRKAYRRALLAAHPDQGGSREQLDLVRTAYSRLREAARPDPAPTDAGSSIARPTTTADTDTGSSIARPTTTARRAFLDAIPADPVADTAPVPTEPAAPSGRPAVVAPGLASSEAPSMTPAGARAAAKFVTAQRFAATTEAPRPNRRRRAGGRTRSRFEQLLERELVRRSGRRVRLASTTDHVGARA